MNAIRQKKILIITVPALNSRVGADTWTTLLEGYDPAYVANLCIRDEEPDSKACSRFFRISENKILKSICNRRIQTGKEIMPGVRSAEDEADLQAHNVRYKKFKVKRRYSMLLARELVWKLGHWRTPELDAFLDDFKPDIILHSMEDYIHLNRIVAYAIRRTGARAIGYIWDDNFTYKQSPDLGYKFYRFFQRLSLRELAELTDHFFAISTKTKREADAFFGIQATVLTKPVPEGCTYREPEYKFPLKMLYTGNFAIGRLDVLKLLVKKLVTVNADGIKIKLDVYTNTPFTEHDKQELTTDFSAIHPPVPQAEVRQLQQEADILLFVESFDDKHKMSRLSFSTKITDYYAAGKCIFAVGNKDLAPMEVFTETDSAITAHCEKELTHKLSALLDFELLAKYAQKAFLTGQANHSHSEIKNVFFSEIYSTPKIACYS